MPVDVAQLEDQLLTMSARDAPGRAFCHAVAELARTARFHELRPLLPAVVYDELQLRYRADPGAFIANWRSLADAMRSGFLTHARSRLTSLTRLQPPHAEPTPAWQEIQRALDSRDHDLLRTALALELIEMIEPAVARATQLHECVVASPCSEEADRYLDEATRCYFYGLYTACAVMCRSVLEEALRQRLPASLARQVRTRYRGAPTLGNLLHEVHNNLRLTGIDPAFLRLANQVNDTGRKAVHQGLLAEDEARLCLQSARESLQLLLRP